MSTEKKLGLKRLFDFKFESYITGEIIKFLYGLALILAGILYIYMVITGFQDSGGTGVIMLLVVGPIAALLFLLYSRVILELMMIVFAIHSELTEIKENIKLLNKE